MTSTNAALENSTAYRQTDAGTVDELDVRALTGCMTVLPDEGLARDAADLYTVVSDSGREYLVDAREGVCECPDYRYRHRECKHVRRVAFATGARPVPDRVDGVDPYLGQHCDGADE